MKKTTPEEVALQQQKRKLTERIFDIETNDKIGADMQSSVITALIRLYKNANLNQNDKEALADNLMSIIDSINSMSDLSEQQRVALFNYAANLANLTFSEDVKSELQDMKISITQFFRYYERHNQFSR